MLDFFQAETYKRQSNVSYRVWMLVEVDQGPIFLWLLRPRRPAVQRNSLGVEVGNLCGLGIERWRVVEKRRLDLPHGHCCKVASIY